MTFPKFIGYLVDETGFHKLWKTEKGVTVTEQQIKREQQTPRESFVEALVGTAIGFLVALAGQAFIMKYYGYATTFTHDLGITLFFTGLSIIRSYAVRRLFERRRK